MNEEEIVGPIVRALREHGSEALGGATAEEAARRWTVAGFDDADEVQGWLQAGCFTPEHAVRLEAAGFTPEQAALRTKAGRGDYEETIAYKTARDDLSLDEARRIITSEFWNS